MSAPGRPQARTATDRDAVDRQLLRMLQADGRASYATMAAAVGLSAPAVRLRVQRLTETGVLQVVAVTDPLGTIDNVIHLALTSGEQELILEVVCRSEDELLTVVNDQIRAVPRVLSLKVSQYYGIHTHRFDWGVPDRLPR